MLGPGDTHRLSCVAIIYNPHTWHILEVRCREPIRELATVPFYTHVL
jgi:hypothetical protein